MSAELPPLPATDWLLHMPDAPYEPAWTSSQAGYSAEDMLNYAAAYAAAAVAAEREACAKLAETSHPHDWAFIGAAIRNRT